MASVSLLKDDLQSRVVLAPHCAACGERTRLASIEPHIKYRRLDIHYYECTCGRTAEEAVTRER